MTLLDMISGAVFFTVSYQLFIYILATWNVYKIRKVDMYTIAMRLVSTVQAVCACIAGGLAAWMCRHDMIHANYWTVEFYSWFGFPYFYYDTWAMYAAFRLKTPQLEALPHSECFPLFMKHNKLMMVHHLLFPLFYFPIIVHMRGGKGDFFVGMLLLCELAIPCISFRAILLQLGKEQSVLYIVNGISMIATFTFCRVLMFPILYGLYGWYADIPFSQVPANIPAICNWGTVILGAVQLYWLYGMIKSAMKFYRERQRRLNASNNSSNAEPLQGNADPLVGNAEPLLGNTEPLLGNTEPLMGDAEPLLGEDKKEN